LHKEGCTNRSRKAVRDAGYIHVQDIAKLNKIFFVTHNSFFLESIINHYYLL